MEPIKVLLPTDFSPQADFAWKLISRLQTGTSIRPTFLHVVPVPGDTPIGPDGQPQTEAPGLQGIYAEQMADALRKLAPLAQLHPDATTHAAFGPLTNSICAFAESQGFDLVAMGTKGNSGLREWLSGSETQHVVRLCNVPVLSMMCDRSDSPMKHLLFVSDFENTIGGPHLGLLKRIQTGFGSQLHLFSVVGGPNETDAVRKRMQAFAVANDLTDYKLEIHRDSDVSDGLVHFIQMHDMDLICIGTHARKGLWNWLRGSVAEQLVNHLYKPMITYHLG